MSGKQPERNAMEATNMNLEYNFPPYTDMVRDLFKTDIPGNHADLMHAAIGIAGECGEVLDAKDRINLFEEFGDIEFYMMALKQRLDHYGYPFTPEFQFFAGVNITNWPVMMSKAGSEILDAVKKCWIYNDRKPNVDLVVQNLTILRQCLNVAYELHGVTQGEILYGNQVKLIGKDGRYKTGKYSDEQALARADKVQVGEGLKISSDGSIQASVATAPSAEGEPEGTGQIVLDGEVKTYELSEVDMKKVGSQ